MTNLTIIKKDENTTLLKNGRKKYATVSLNPNPDYKWTVYFKTGIALSGYRTESEAIQRANRMHNEWQEQLRSLTQN